MYFNPAVKMVQPEVYLLSQRNRASCRPETNQVPFPNLGREWSSALFQVLAAALPCLLNHWSLTVRASKSTNRPAVGRALFPPHDLLQVCNTASRRLKSRTISHASNSQVGLSQLTHIREPHSTSHNLRPLLPSLSPFATLTNPGQRPYSTTQQRATAGSSTTC